jgi:hypothetical protein
MPFIELITQNIISSFKLLNVAKTMPEKTKIGVVYTKSDKGEERLRKCN